MFFDCCFYLAGEENVGQHEKSHSVRLPADGSNYHHPSGRFAVIVGFSKKHALGAVASRSMQNCNCNCNWLRRRTLAIRFAFGCADSRQQTADKRQTTSDEPKTKVAQLQTWQLMAELENWLTVAWPRPGRADDDANPCHYIAIMRTTPTEVSFTSFGYFHPWRRLDGALHGVMRSFRSQISLLGNNLFGWLSALLFSWRTRLNARRLAGNNRNTATCLLSTNISSNFYAACH